MVNDQDNFSQETARPSGLRTKVGTFHSRMTETEMESVRDRRWLFGMWVYRFAIVMTSEITRTELTRRAAALTYTTILSLFPLLAVLTATLSVIYTKEKQNELFSYIERQFLPSMNSPEDVPLMLSPEVRATLRKQTEAGENIRAFFSTASEKFRSSAGGVGVFGFIGLLVTGGLLYYSIESVVNQTWREEDRGRWVQTITNFIVILVLAPIVLALSITTTTIAYSFLDPRYGEVPAQKPAPAPAADATATAPTAAKAAAPVGPMLPAAAEEGPPMPVGPMVGPALPGPAPAAAAAETTTTTASAPAAGAVTPDPSQRQPVSGMTLRDQIRLFTVNFGFILPVIPVLVNVLILTCAYAFLPKTRVRFGPALMGGLVAALLWELAKYLFVFYIYGSTVNRTLAGAFGLSILFLIWVYITWVILLLGNLLVYVLQNFHAIWSEMRTGGEVMLDSRLYLATMLLLARRFQAVGGGYSEHELRVRLGINSVEFRRILQRLQRNGYISAMADGTFQVSHPPEQIRARELLQQGCNLAHLPVARRGRSALTRLFETLEDRTIDLCGDCSLADMLQEMTLPRQSADPPLAAKETEKA